MESLIGINNTYDEPDTLLSTCFNQDISCFAAGTERGFRIYNISPFKSSFKRDLGGGISLVAMLNRCNIVALVGGGKNPRYSQKQVVIWDDAQNKEVYKMTFPTFVVNIRLKKDRLYVVLLNKILIYSLRTFELIDSLDTCENKLGVFGVSNNPRKNVFAFPERRNGFLTVKNAEENKSISFKSNSSSLGCTEVNYDGTLIAACSVRGTVIRIYNEKGDLMQELRRGSEAAIVYSIAFDLENKFLACSSDRGTIHIFFVNIHSQSGVNQKTFIGKLTSKLGIQNHYLNSERSFAQLRINSYCKTLCAFGPNNTIYAINKDGFFYQAKFDVNIQGDCIIEIQQPTNL